MAKIKVIAMKDVGPIVTKTWIDQQGRPACDGRMYKKGEVFEIDEKHFSDWNKVQNIKGITFRGSMKRVEENEPLVVADAEPAKGGKELI